MYINGTCTYTHTSPEQFTGGAGSLPPPPEVKDSFQAGILSKVLSLFFFLLTLFANNNGILWVQAKEKSGRQDQTLQPIFAASAFFVSDT